MLYVLFDVYLGISKCYLEARSMQINSQGPVPNFPCLCKQPICHSAASLKAVKVDINEWIKQGNLTL